MEYLQSIYVFMSIFIIAIVLKKNTALFYLGCLVFTSSLYVVFSPNSKSPGETKITTVNEVNGVKVYNEIMSTDVLRIQSAKALIIIFVSFLFAFYFKEYGEKICFYLSLISSFVVYYNYFLDPRNATGLCRNTSADGTLLAIMVPFIFSWASRRKLSAHLIVLIPLIAILLTKSSVGIGGFILGAVIYYSLRTVRIVSFKKWLFLIFIALVIMTISARIYIGSDFFDDTHRFQAWAFFMKWWAQDIDRVIFGTGFGTFWAYGPWLQYSKQFTPHLEIFTFMHNDWFEILFEIGVIGFILAFWQYLRGLVNTSRIEIFTSMVVLGACAFFNMPFKYPLSCGICFLILSMAISKEKECHDRNQIEEN